MNDPHRRRDLTRYYDAEAAAGLRTELRDFRIRFGDEVMATLRSERRQRVLDVGTGSGLDGARFVTAGFDAVGVDLSPGNVALAGAAGVPSIVASLLDLPISTASVDLVWTMSTLVHIADDEFDVAMGELTRVCRPGGLIVVGSWGSTDWEGTYDVTRFEPPRFFSHRRHDRWKTMLADHGDVERFETVVTDEPGWEYQFAVLRR